MGRRHDGLKFLFGGDEADIQRIAGDTGTRGRNAGHIVQGGMPSLVEFPAQRQQNIRRNQVRHDRHEGESGQLPAPCPRLDRTGWLRGFNVRIIHIGCVSRIPV